MCEPATLTAMAIGAGVGAAGAAATGGGVLQGALFGAATGAFTGGLSPSMGASAAANPFVGVWGTTGSMSYIGSTLGASTAFSATFGMSAAQALGLGVTGLATSVASGLLMPQQQDYSQYYQGAYGSSNPIAYNTQQSVVTGSGGRQASALLAEEIKRAKTRRAAQADVGNIDLATSLSNTGLQIA